MRMGGGMVADVVTVVGDRLDVVGVFVDPLLDEEEGAFDLVFIEDLEQGFESLK